MTEAFPDSPQPSPGSALWRWCCGAVVAIVFFLVSDPFLAPPDCVSYWAWGVSFFTDLDFDFSDEYDATRMPIFYVPLTETGRLGNDWPLGTGLYLGPALVLGRAWAQALVVFLLVCVLAAWCRYAATSSKAARRAALLGTVAGTPLLFYALFGPFFSHPISFVLCSSFLLLWSATFDRRERRHWVLLGFLLGMAMTVRPQNAVLALALAGEGLSRRSTLGGIASWSQFLAGALLGFVPQLIGWAALYGSPFHLPKVDEMQWLAPEFGKTLFSDFHGILPWTPVFGLAALGLVLLGRRNRPLALGLALVLLAQLYLNAANFVWWSGGSFGNRRMTDAALIVAWGCATLMDYRGERWWKVTTVAAIVLCAAWSLLLLLAERSGDLLLSRYIPFSDPRFREGLLSTITEPQRVVHGLLRGLRDQALLPRALAAVVLAVAIPLALRVGPGLVSFLSRRPGVLTSGAILAFLAALCLVAALRTGPLADPYLIERLPKKSRILWDNYMELTEYHGIRGDFLAAEEAARLALDERPDAAGSWAVLARALENQGDMTGSIKCWAKVLELDPNHVTAQDRMSRVEMKLVIPQD